LPAPASDLTGEEVHFVMAGHPTVERSRDVARLFPAGLGSADWATFEAAGFEGPVTGAIHRRSSPARCGMPLGGIDTGCIDLETSGLLGFATIFNSHVPRRDPLHAPFLGVNVGGRTWLLTTGQRSREIGAGSAANGFRPVGPPRPDLSIPGVRLARDCEYWGHYPIADLEYELDAPIKIGVRAWSPFLPGDVWASVVPAAVFEVHLRNPTDAPMAVTLAASFDGPTSAEAACWLMNRSSIDGPVEGIAIEGKRSAFALGVIGASPVRTGAALGIDGVKWGGIGVQLPSATAEDRGASVAVDREIAAGGSVVVKVVLSWHSPDWNASGDPAQGPRTFRHMYSRQYRSASDAAAFLATNYDQLLARILAWQGRVYGDDRVPSWLADVLINQLHVYAEAGFWATADAPIGEWCRPEDGLFGLMESPRLCPQMETLPVSFYGTIPIAYFFPELALSTLRGQKAYQLPNGAPPFILGGEASWTRGPEMASPTIGYSVSLSTASYLTALDRFLLLHGDPELDREFLASVEASIGFLEDLNRAEYGIVAMPDRIVSEWPGVPFETEWYEWGRWVGIVPHVGGLNVATLRIAERIARRAGDDAFADHCADLATTGLEVLETQAWVGSHYLRFVDPRSGERSEDIFAAQLDGEWLANVHGLGGLFRSERVSTALDTIDATCVAATSYGTVLYATADGAAVGAGTDVVRAYPPTEGHMAAVVSLGLAMVTNGRVDDGLDIMRRIFHNNVCRQGLTWYGENTFDTVTGEPLTGTEYAIKNLVWAVLGALHGGDLRTPAAPGGLVRAILDASSIEIAAASSSTPPR
jgi:uncharacterized protein (DUF608 family)